MADVEHVIAHYPWSEEIFREMSKYVNRPEEVIYMFSEALKIADKNTVKYTIEELQDKATHEAELRKQETKLRKQTEAELQLSRENEQKLQERIAELEALLATRS